MLSADGKTAKMLMLPVFSPKQKTSVGVSVNSGLRYISTDWVRLAEQASDDSTVSVTS
jgi:hypothetical protein